MPRYFVCLLLMVSCLFTPSARAAMKVGHICTYEGQTEIRLTGTGLVVGLNGTGDGGDNLATMRALVQEGVLDGTQLKSVEELKKSGNSVALVNLSATIPLTGIEKGQKLNARVSVKYGCKSLNGGVLLLSTIHHESLANNETLGLVEGPIIVDDKALPTSGHISGGLVMQQSVGMNIMRKARQVRLLIKKPFASFQMAREVARAVNENFKVETNYKTLATAVSPTAVDVNMPDQYDNLVEFAAIVEDVVLKDTAAKPRIVVNAKSGTIVVTGDVEISPAVISHRSLTVDTTERFVSLQDTSRNATPQQLTDLVEALNRLRVPTSDMIAILRSLAQTGRMYAEIVEE